MNVFEFKGSHSYLSNFYPSAVTYEGRLYPTVEHAYQAAKTLSNAEREEIRNATTPGEAKRLGKRASLRADWPLVKQGIMLGLLLQKFQRYPELRAHLLSTTGWLEEGNMWGDNEWGVCPPRSGLGQNLLGKLLMSVRVYLSFK